RRYEKTGSPGRDDARDARRIGADDRNAARLRLEKRDADRLVDRGPHEEIARAKLACDRVGRERARKGYPRRERREGGGDRSARRTVADDRQLERDSVDPSQRIGEQ